MNTLDKNTRLSEYDESICSTLLDDEVFFEMTSVKEDEQGNYDLTDINGDMWLVTRSAIEEYLESRDYGDLPTVAELIEEIKEKYGEELIKIGAYQTGSLN